MIKTTAEHTFEDSLLSKDGWAIDFGCGVDFTFSKAMLAYGLNVIGVDPNPEITEPLVKDKFHFLPYALSVHNADDLNLSIFNDTDAASIVPTAHDVSFVKKTNQTKISGRNIQYFQSLFNINQFDIAKLDIEGSEYQFLLDLQEPIAKQLSIEFHDFRGMNPFSPNNEQFYDVILPKLCQWYTIVQHKKTPHPGFPNSDNYWDSLFILK
jgi:FkbM family methyltransferase